MNKNLLTLTNPFMPGNGIEPPYLAGRSGFLSDFEQSLKISERGLPRNMVLVGRRGTGKTVLLRRFRMCSAQGTWAFVEREFNEKFCDESKFAEAISADIVVTASELSILKKLREKGKNLLNQIKPKELSVYGITYRPFYKRKGELLEDYLKDILVSNWDVLKQSNKKGVVFFYDEFHTVKDDKATSNFPLASFLGALSYAQREGCRYYLVLSGLPNLKANLKNAKTYTERMFDYKKVESLDKESAKKAITEPLSNSKYSFSKELVNHIVKETRGYPYFLQFYPFFTIEQSTGKNIGMAHFKKIQSDLLGNLDIGFYEDRFERASDSEKDILYAMAIKGDGEATISEIGKKSKIEYAILVQLLLRLMDKGLVYRPRRGTYRFSLPLFGDFVRRRMQH